MEHPVTLTYLGHASWLIEIDGLRIYTDPHASPRALVPRRYTDPAPSVDVWPQADAVVVSHGHWDHCDVATLRRVAPGTLFCYPPDLRDPCGRIRAERHAPLGWWESATQDALTVTAVPANHFGRRWFRERPRGYCGFIISVGSTHVYFAGDTAYFDGFKDIGARFDVHAALIPVGAYEPRGYMKRVHCNPDDAVRAFEDMGAHVLVPMHWGTFPLTTEAPDEPLDWTVDLMRRRGLERRLCVIPHGYTATIAVGAEGVHAVPSGLAKDA